MNNSISAVKTLEMKN